MPVLECLNLADVLIEKRDIEFTEDNHPFHGTVKNMRAIPSSAFYGKSTLSRIIFPKELDAISYGAFGYTSLTGSLKIPEGVMTIESWAFEQCAKLNGKLSLPSTLKSIGGGAFFECTNIIGELNLPDGLEHIGGHAFYLCRGLSGQLMLPHNLRRIESDAFNGCKFSGDLKIPADAFT